MHKVPVISNVELGSPYKNPSWNFGPLYPKFFHATPIGFAVTSSILMTKSSLRSVSLWPLFWTLGRFWYWIWKPMGDVSGLVSIVSNQCLLIKYTHYNFQYLGMTLLDNISFAYLILWAICFLFHLLSPLLQVLINNCCIEVLSWRKINNKNNICWNILIAERQLDILFNILFLWGSDNDSKKWKRYYVCTPVKMSVHYLLLSCMYCHLKKNVYV